MTSSTTSTGTSTTSTSLTGNNIYTYLNSNGSSTIAGISSGLDTTSIINALVSAREAPAVTLQNKISANQDKITAYQKLQSLISDFQTALSPLTGSFNTASVFDQMSISATSSEGSDAPPGYTGPSDASNILGALSTTGAQAGTHTVEVKQLAQAEQLRTDVVSDKTGDLAAQGFATGDFTINGKTITVSGTTSLIDLRDQINGAGAGVTATIVSASSNQYYLVVSSTDTGTANAVDFGGGNAVTDGLGLTDGAGGTKNVLQAAQDAIIDVDGLGTDITRSSNTISDVLDGVTLDLYKAELGTTVTLNIQPDLNAVETDVQSFVTAFNAIRDFVTQQRQTTGTDSSGNNTYGPLAFDSSLQTLMNQLNSVVSGVVAGQPNGYASLSQIGVSMDNNFDLNVDTNALSDSLLGNINAVKSLFQFSSSTSNAQVQVVGFSGNTQPNVDADGNIIPYYVNIAGTDANGNVTSASINTTAGAGDGSDDGSISVNSTVMNATNQTGASGLQLTYLGGPNVTTPLTDVQVTVKQGIASQLSGLLKQFANSTSTGSIDTQITTLQTQDTSYQTQIQKIDDQANIYRQQLVARFTAMEQAVAKAQSLQQSLKSTFQAGQSAAQN